MGTLQRWRALLPPLQTHPDPELRWAWNLAQICVLILPFSTLLGVVGCLVSTILVWRSRGKALLQQPIYQGFAALSGLLILSAILAHSPPAAGLGLFNFLPFFFGFAGLCELLPTPAQLRRLAWLIVLPSIPVCLLGLGQLLLGWWGDRQVIQVQVLWILLDWTIDPNGTPPGRMSANFFYANVLANYLIITLVLALGLTIAAFWQRRKGEQWVLLTALFLNGLALILTNSRNGWAIAAAAYLVFAIYLGRRWLVVGVSLLVGLVLGAAFAPSPLQTGLRVIVPRFFWARLTDELFPNRPVPTLRTTQWEFALHLTQERPWLGWGLRNFTPLYQQATGFLLGHPHNLFLMLLCETGIPATLVFVGLVGWIQAQAVQRVRSLHPGLNPWHDSSDRLMLFSFIAAFLSNTAFNLFDVTLFDARINLLGWLVLAGTGGMTIGLAAVARWHTPPTESASG